MERDWWQGEDSGDGDGEREMRFLDGRSTLMPLREGSDLVAFSSSDSRISPSDGVDCLEAMSRSRSCKVVQLES